MSTVARATAGLVLATATASVVGCRPGRAQLPRPTVLEVLVSRGLGPGETATGFALGPGRLVTVAHVLADRGVGAPVRLCPPDSCRRSRRATVLALDERDDLAVLAVPGLLARPPRTGRARGEAIVLALRRGSVSALPASVRRSILARIRTPDGRRIVRRPALELRADIQPGDSGAPVISADGRVAGIVFARSALQPQLAYAVDASVLSPLIRAN